MSCLHKCISKLDFEKNNMVKVKKISRLNLWKPVEINASLLSGSLDGLVGIEECTNYDTEIYLKNKKKNVTSIDKRGYKTNTSKRKRAAKIKVKEANILTPSKNGSTIEDTHETSENFLDDLPNMGMWDNFGLSSAILKALNHLKFREPTEIQRLTLPAAILGKRDILGAAQTGSGKTLAFGLPIITGILQIKQKNNESDLCSVESDFDEVEEIVAGVTEDGLDCVINKVHLNMKRKPLYALILTPTRELAFQVKNHLDTFAKCTDLNIAVIVGGMAAVKQERILDKGPEIVIATPGRLWELIQTGNNHLSQVEDIKFLAIDETDRMLERGHFQELQDLLERINLDETKKKQRQNFVFSATLTLVHELPKHIINKNKLKKSRKVNEMTAAQKLQKIVDVLGITDSKIVDITKGTGTSGTLTECRLTCDIDEKDYYVYYFLERHPGRTLIFCNSIGCVKRLTTLLGLLNCNPLALHASMQQRQRLKNLDRFRDNKNSILIATDVAARGLDIPLVEHVLHYQTPRTSESYVHRSGRTARASREGITILLIEPSEFQNYLGICRTLGKNEDLPIFPVQENYLNAVKQRVNLARELDKLQLQVRKTNSEIGWFQKAAKEMDIIVDDFAKKFDEKEVHHAKKSAETKRKQLATLLSNPIFPKGFSGKYPLNSDLSVSLMQGSPNQEKAVDVMKGALESYAKEKKRFVPLYKPNKKFNNKSNGVIKLPKFKSDKKVNKFKRRSRK